MARPNAALRPVFRAPVYLYRWKCGWLLGHRFLLVTHVGRRTGQRRHPVLEVMEYRKEGPEAVVMSAFGRNADWLRNIEATSSPAVVIGSRRFIASYRFLDEEDAMRVVAGYEHRNRLITRIIRLVLSRLLGWRYDGSKSASRRFGQKTPCL